MFFADGASHKWPGRSVSGNIYLSPPPTTLAGKDKEGADSDAGELR